MSLTTEEIITAISKMSITDVMSLITKIEIAFLESLTNMK